MCTWDGKINYCHQIHAFYNECTRKMVLVGRSGKYGVIFDSKCDRNMALMKNIYYFQISKLNKLKRMCTSIYSDMEKNATLIYLNMGKCRNKNILDRFFLGTRKL